MTVVDRSKPLILVADENSDRTDRLKELMPECEFMIAKTAQGAYRLYRSKHRKIQVVVLGNTTWNSPTPTTSDLPKLVSELVLRIRGDRFGGTMLAITTFPRLKELMLSNGCNAVMEDENSLFEAVKKAVEGETKFKRPAAA